MTSFSELKQHTSAPRRFKPVALIAELMVTAGILAGLFVVWELFVTEIGTDSEREESIAGFYDQMEPAQQATVEEGTDFEVCYELDDGTEIGCAESMRTQTGYEDVMATVYAPAMGQDWAAPVRSGVAPAQIDRGGVGHYTTTQLPDELGNFAVAGHRNTYGSMLGDQDALSMGDEIFVVAAEGIFVYEVSQREVVAPWQNEALLPVPWQTDIDVEPETSMMTLTTCHPMYSSRERLIHHAEITDFVPVGGELPDGLDYVDELDDLYGGQ